MLKAFSTQLDAKLLRSLDIFCRRYHLKKSSLLEEIIAEGIRKRMEALALAKSIERGLEEEQEGDLLTAAEVENKIFGKKKAG